MEICYSHHSTHLNGKRSCSSEIWMIKKDKEMIIDLSPADERTWKYESEKRAIFKERVKTDEKLCFFLD